jgi:hypothetical protein
MNDRILTNPLIVILRRAQDAVCAGRALIGPSKAETIQTLHDVLCTGPADDAIATAERFTADQVKQAQARFLPALEAAHNKLTQLRPNYDGTMGMSIDNDLARIAAMLNVAREAAR